MNKDIRLSTTFWDHWKTITLKTDLGLEAVECLQRLWCFVAINKPDGVKTETKSARLWEAYTTVYQDRYGVAPIRNAKVNSQLCQLVDRLGTEAPAVAGFYLRHNNAWYVKHGHSVGCLLADAEKLRTEWATGRQITTAGAHELDRKQATVNAYERVYAKYAALDAANAAKAHDHAH